LAEILGKGLEDALSILCRLIREDVIARGKVTGEPLKPFTGGDPWEPQS
jgi:hypothetical protein